MRSIKCREMAFFFADYALLNVQLQPSQSRMEVSVFAGHNSASCLVWLRILLLLGPQLALKGFFLRKELGRKPLSRQKNHPFVSFSDWENQSTPGPSRYRSRAYTERSVREILLWPSPPPPVRNGTPYQKVRMAYSFALAIR